MQRVAKLLGMLLICFCVVSPGITQAEDPGELVFGIISTDATTYLKEQFQPLINDMSKAVNMEIKAFFAPDYAGVIEAMRFKKVDLAWFGNKSAIEAVDRANAEVFAHVSYADGSPGYWSLLITHKDTGIKNLDDVIKSGKNYTFSNGDPNSTSGFLVPAYYVFAQNHMDPNTHFKRMTRGNHESNALAVINKQVDLATFNTMAFKRIQERFPDKAKNIHIVWQSPLIPHDPMAWRKDLSDEVRSKIKAFFMSYGRMGANAQSQKKVLAGMMDGWAPFVDSSNKQLLPIRQLELFKNKLKIENDNRMDQAEKNQKIGEIENQLVFLSRLSEFPGI